MAACPYDYARLSIQWQNAESDTKRINNPARKISTISRDIAINYSEMIFNN